MSVMGKGADIGVAFAAHDFYRLGNDIGGILATIIALGQTPDTA